MNRFFGSRSKKNKYGNKKIVIDGIKFDSKKEGKKYLQLKIMKRGGQIKNFELQVKFELQPKFEKDGYKYRAIVYRADFVVTDWDDKKRIIEIKPFSKKKNKFLYTKEFAIKQKMFDFKYPELPMHIE